MRKTSFFTMLGMIACLLFTFSCKSKFEKVRTSNDAALIYKKALEYYEAEEYQKAQTLFELAITGYRGKKEAEDITFKYAYTFYHQGSFILAAHHFENFSRTFSTSPYREESDFMVAYSNFQLSPSFRLDQSYTKEAIDAFQLFVNTYPNSDRVSECNRLIDAMRLKQEIKATENGKLYFDLRQYQAAILTFENLLKDFPETDRAEWVRYFIARSSFLLAENSVIDKKKERLEETIERANEFLSRYEGSEYTDEVESILENANKRINQLENVRYKNQSARTGS